VVLPEHGNPVNQTVKLIPVFLPFFRLRSSLMSESLKPYHKWGPFAKPPGFPRGYPFPSENDDIVLPTSGKKAAP
jgi:hypothetical protein